ncbi:hypothetical protein CDL12_18977 [Handroanthus impetiginosus]|uniref:EF-hand domain-containing protein n=1 Tax=Handroanthus impetiginosus TaxID=429701 RepID=A0A2G9GTA4_9LAMI|nr:hypothetical protein CDL12_18977 [Handroanthus impetiginosus]
MFSLMSIFSHDRCRCPNQCHCHGEKVQISEDEFKKWVMKFDHNKGGRISRTELRDAIKSRGGWFCWLKSGRAMGEADVDGSGFIDEHEINCLVNFAEGKLRFKIG